MNIKKVIISVIITLLIMSSLSLVVNARELGELIHVDRAYSKDFHGPYMDNLTVYHDDSDTTMTIYIRTINPHPKDLNIKVHDYIFYDGVSFTNKGIKKAWYHELYPNGTEVNKYETPEHIGNNWFNVDNTTLDRNYRFSLNEGTTYERLVIELKKDKASSGTYTFGDSSIRQWYDDPMSNRKYRAHWSMWIY